MVALYADCANLEQMERYASHPLITGLTTNPTIMRKAGITNYRSFAKTVMGIVGVKPVSFEVLADDHLTMERQAREIASWGANATVKIPITNTLGESSAPLIERIAGLYLNVTAVMTVEQIQGVLPHLRPHHILSVFVGRIMDTGAAPPRVLGDYSFRVLWASAREVYHVKMAEEYGYDIITLTPDLIEKLPLFGKDLTQYSLDTVRQFHADGQGIAF